MRQITLTLCFLTAILFFWGVDPSHCASRFTNGFHSVKWGTHKDDLPDLGMGKTAFKNIYDKGPSATLFMEGVGKLEMNFENVPLIAIYLRFQDAKFNGFDFVFNPLQRDSILALVEKDLGMKGDACESGLCWKEGTLEIILTDRELLVSKALNL